MFYYVARTPCICIKSAQLGFYVSNMMLLDAKLWELSPHFHRAVYEVFRESFFRFATWAAAAAA